MSKYGAKPTVVDGYRFDSRAESVRYIELRLLLAVGQITKLAVHPVYIIWEGEVYRNSKKCHETIKYEADFSYCENGVETVEDVKGVLTEVYRLKKKMFLARYSGVKFVEIKA